MYSLRQLHPGAVLNADSRLRQPFPGPRGEGGDGDTAVVSRMTTAVCYAQQRVPCASRCKEGLVICCCSWLQCGTSLYAAKSVPFWKLHDVVSGG